MINELPVRATALIAFAATTVAGLWTRSAAFPGSGFWSQHVGTALWATALYWVVRFAAPAWTVRCVLATTLLLAWSVELLQLTPVSRTISSLHPVLRLVFGASFDARDMVSLAVGAVLAAGIDAGGRRAVRWRGRGRV